MLAGLFVGERCGEVTNSVAHFDGGCVSGTCTETGCRAVEVGVRFQEVTEADAVTEVVNLVTGIQNVGYVTNVNTQTAEGHCETSCARATTGDGVLVVIFVGFETEASFQFHASVGFRDTGDVDAHTLFDAGLVGFSFVVCQTKACGAADGEFCCCDACGRDQCGRSEENLFHGFPSGLNFQRSNRLTPLRSSSTHILSLVLGS